MATVNIDTTAASLGGSVAQADRLGPKVIIGSSVLVLYSSNEPGELSQWLCLDDSTINTMSFTQLLTYTHY